MTKKDMTLFGLEAVVLAATLFLSCSFQSPTHHEFFTGRVRYDWDGIHSAARQGKIVRLHVKGITFGPGPQKLSVFLWDGKNKYPVFADELRLHRWEGREVIVEIQTEIARLSKPPSADVVFVADGPNVTVREYVVEIVEPPGDLP
jgi:hypothetical protein